MPFPIDGTTILFAVLAIFVVIKLRSVLGQRTGEERPPHNPFVKDRPSEPDAAPPASNVTPLRPPGAATSTSGAAAPAPAARDWSAFALEGAGPGLSALAAADPSFDPPAFLAGARGAYEMIVSAFARGDRAALRPLLGPEVERDFEAAIATREAEGQTVETALVSLDEPRVEDAALMGATAHVTVRFVSKMVTATRDRGGAVIAGAADKIVPTTDIWTFARELGARDPNWRLIGTRTG